MRKLLYIVIIVLAVAGCGRVKPQRPTQRSSAKQETKVDSAALAMMLLNQRLAEEADQQLAALMTNLADDGWVFDGESKTWQHWQHRNNDGRTPQEGETWTIGLQVSQLDSTLLLDDIRQHTIGQSELPNCVQDALVQMHEGDTLMLVAPWYTAYGATGTEEVSAYCNVSIVLTLQYAN